MPCKAGQKSQDGGKEHWKPLPSAFTHPPPPSASRGPGSSTWGKEIVQEQAASEKPSRAWEVLWHIPSFGFPGQWWWWGMISKGVGSHCSALHVFQPDITSCSEKPLPVTAIQCQIPPLPSSQCFPPSKGAANRGAPRRGWSQGEQTPLRQQSPPLQGRCPRGSWAEGLPAFRARGRQTVPHRGRARRRQAVAQVFGEGSPEAGQGEGNSWRQQEKGTP